MTENNFPSVMKGFILITLFIFLLVAITINVSEKYYKDTSEIEEALNFEAINKTIESTKATSEGWKNAFEKQNIFTVLGGIIVTGIFNIANTMTSFILTPFAIFGNILINILGIPAIVINVVTALLILTIIFGVWRLIKQGR